MRRAAFYLFFDPQGQVDEYIGFKLERLRPHVEHIFVVSNSELDEVNRAKLEAVADTVWVRENVGLDVWAYKEAMQVFGADRLAEYDELLLLNYTFFGPVGSFDELFAESERHDVDFWGITEHDRVEPHPFSPELEALERHVQSHWIGVRASMFTSPTWRDYWGDMPMIASYFDSVNRHEGRFTQHFADAGFSHWVAYPVEEYASIHPVMDDTAEVLRDGCPIVKRRSFFADPLYLESRAIDGREILDVAAERGYPVEKMLSNLARTSEPRALVTNLNLLEILPVEDLGAPPAPGLTAALVAHVFYPEMTAELLDRAAFLPEGSDLVITTADEAKRERIEQTLAERGVSGEVRVVGSNRGRDISAFLVDCRDVLLDGGHDVVIKLHSKRSPQDGLVGQAFKKHLFDNLLASRAYVARVLELFVRHDSLGMVLPPTVHIGYPTLGHGWFGNREKAEEEAARVGIRVPFDAATPLATYGSMFIARPEALGPLLRAGYGHADFPDESGYSDGGLAHVLERLLSYCVLSEGYHVREVMTPASAALNYSHLEYKHQALASLLPGYPLEQAEYIRSLQRDSARLRRLERRRSRAGRPGRGRGDLVATELQPLEPTAPIAAVRSQLGGIVRSVTHRGDR